MKKHTPGPWRVERNANNSAFTNGLIIRPTDTGAHGEWVADVGSQIDPQRIANANLIAAAPELLQACKAILADIVDAKMLDRFQSSALLLTRAMMKATDVRVGSPAPSREVRCPRCGTHGIAVLDVEHPGHYIVLWKREGQIAWGDAYVTAQDIEECRPDREVNRANEGFGCGYCWEMRA